MATDLPLLRPYYDFVVSTMGNKRGLLYVIPNPQWADPDGHHFKSITVDTRTDEWAVTFEYDDATLGELSIILDAATGDTITFANGRLDI